MHVSQASLGESKKDKESAPIHVYVKIGDQKLVVGTLSSETRANISLNLVFKKEFELSQSSKNGSVYFCGYKTIIREESDVFSGAKEEEPKPAMDEANAAKPESSVPKKLNLLMGPKNYEDDEDEHDDESEEDESDNEDILEGEDQRDEDSRRRRFGQKR
ncbi:histone deacetylase HDT1-like [Tasmannia lanceolata]|uniref:histone deacetylase HDT1-like n=1 Tax=Tasmannia lanceolata TaxID=3420 RepID=UPI004062DAE8